MYWHHVFVVVTPVDVRGLVQLQHREQDQLARSKLGGSVAPLALLRVSDEVPSDGYKFQGEFALSGCELMNQTEDVAQNAARRAGAFSSGSH
jgi:hypothetical protein